MTHVPDPFLSQVEFWQGWLRSPLEKVAKGKEFHLYYSKKRVWSCPTQHGQELTCADS